MKYPHRPAGTLSEILANEGDTVEVDALLGQIAEGAAKAAAAPAEGRAAATAKPAETGTGGSDGKVRGNADAAIAFCGQDDGRKQASMPIRSPARASAARC